MPKKSSLRNRCKICDMHMPLCICSVIPVVSLKTKVVVIMHWRERKLTSNSAKLACLALPNSELHFRGEKGNPLLMDSLLPTWPNPVLLYPTEDAIELTENTAKELPHPITLLVPDGSWRQAQKVAAREQSLKHIPKIKLPRGTPSNYRLRRSPNLDKLSTFEAIARSVGILESAEAQNQLERLFLTRVERILWSRGDLKADHATTGIPEEAFLYSRLAGSAKNLSQIS